MKKLEDVLDCVKYGATLKIQKEVKLGNEDIYNCYLLRYDGKIFKDVLAVEISNFLTLIPNIKEMVDEGYTYQMSYNNQTSEYCSYIDDYEYDNHELTASNKNLFDSMIALDTNIANTALKRKIVHIKKYITGAFEKVRKNGAC